MEKKTVGVVTMHRVINYGSFLQAYATQKSIEKLGHLCEIVDYVFPNEWHYENGLRKPAGIKPYLSKFIYPLGLTKGHRKTKEINKAINNYLNLSKKYDRPEAIHLNPPVYDVYVTGSDQTWNPKHTVGDDVFLLAFSPENKSKISFSASLAGKNIKAEYLPVFKENLPKYNNIAIRDSNGNEAVKTIIGRCAEVTLDPTLMLNRDEWAEFGKNEAGVFEDKKYIVFYLITHSFDSTPYIYELLRDLQNKTGYHVYSFSKIPEQYGIKSDVCTDLSVEHFIQLYQKASYVVTSSFHGTAFAANFGIPMYSVVKDMEFDDDRQSSLLTKLGITNCLVPIGKNFDDVQPEYDVDSEQAKLEELRVISREYLEKTYKISFNKITVLSRQSKFYFLARNGPLAKV